MKQKQTRKRLGDLIVEAGLITEEQLQMALQDKLPNQKLGDALLQKGLITEQQLIEVLEVQLGVPHISLYGYPFETNLFSLISRDTASRNLVVPLRKDGDKLLVAMADPMDFFAIDDLRLSTGFQIEKVIATRDDIVRTINKFYDVDEDFEEMMEKPKNGDSNQEESLTDESSPIVKLVNQILLSAVTQKASDIHVDPQETKVVVRYRVDGILRVERTLPKNMQSVLTARIKILANLDITEHRVPQDGRIKVNVEYYPIDLRVSTLPTVYGEKVVMRILDLSSSLTDIEKLSFNKVNLARFKQLIEKPNGIVLITGPTGSGKSSTLYAALNKMNNESVNIITVEDPVEYRLEGISQIQVNSNVGMTFAAGLRAILRQDPDIVMVGEIRDRETAETAVRASLTGHLVLSTLHTNDAISSINRLIDMGVEPFLVATALTGVVAQRLVRKVCRDCAEAHEPSNRELEMFAKRGLKIERIMRGKGCASCNMSGYKGRVAIQEVVVVDDEIRRLVMNGESVSKLRQVAVQNKTIFLVDDGLLKVKQGMTTTEEVLRVAIPE